MDRDDRYTRITLRIPKDLHGRLTAAAEETSKSTNAEIIGRLESSFLSPSIDSMSVSELMDVLAAKVKEKGLDFAFTVSAPDLEGDESR